MRSLLLLTILSCTIVSVAPSVRLKKETSVPKMEEFLERYNTEAVADSNNFMDAYWNRVTDISDQHKKAESEAFIKTTQFWRKMNKKAKQFDWKSLEEGSMKRQFSKLSESGISILSDADLKEFSRLDQGLQSMYSLAKVCKNRKDCMNLTPGLTNLMATSRDYEELKWAWSSWRNVSGRNMKADYEKLVSLLNKSAKLNDYDDEGARWRSLYESATFRQDMQHLYDQLKPLYQHLHAYVRRALGKVYGEKIFPSSGHIPANILGNMWAQHWNNIEQLVIPYPNQPKLDVTERMKSKGYTPLKMFKMAEQFFESLGLSKMTDTFWSKSMFTRPKGRTVICHPSAEDFYRTDDFRIKMCAEVKFEDLVTIHHEMGHIEYFMAYSKQPFLFRDGANAGFHEAIGNVMSLSVSTPSHLNKIGILDKVEDNEMYDINFLMGRALDTLAFLPFGFMIDQWRWDVFDGSVPSDQYNRHWWQLRCKYQGIYPPVARQPDDFDPGAKFHVAANVAYIRYFVAYVIEYQFHKTLCKEAGWQGALHKCDIFNSKEAGTKLRKMLEMGASKPWQDAMQLMDGSRKMDATAIVQYFSPLMEWLKRENKGHEVGWSDSCPKGSFADDDRNSQTKATATISLVFLCALLSLATITTWSQ